MLEKNTVRLFINISSLHEMTRDQIAMYLKLIDRLTDGYFYTKQWKVSINPEDGISIRHEDYPIPEAWNRLYLRTPKVQVSFFEAMYRLSIRSKKEFHMPSIGVVHLVRARNGDRTLREVP